MNPTVARIPTLASVMDLWNSGSTMPPLDSVEHSSTLDVLGTRTTSRQSQSAWMPAVLEDTSPRWGTTMRMRIFLLEMIPELVRGLIAKYLPGPPGHLAPSPAAEDGWPWRGTSWPIPGMEEDLAPRSWPRDADVQPWIVTMDTETGTETMWRGRNNLVCSKIFSGIL